MHDAFAEFDHPAWLTMAGTIAGWALMLGLILVVLFVVPFALFVLLP